MRPALILTCLALALPFPALAAEKPDECAGRIVAPPADLSAWGQLVQGGLTAGDTVAAAPVLTPGQAVELALRPAGQVLFASGPGKPGTADSFAGLIAFQVDRAGTWRVALGKAAWVDVVRDGVPVASTGHGHGPACTGIRKIVDFPLAPGRYLLQLAGAVQDRVTALILPPG